MASTIKQAIDKHLPGHSSSTLRVYTFPANGGHPHPETFKLIKEPISTPAPLPGNSKSEEQSELSLTQGSATNRRIALHMDEDVQHGSGEVVQNGSGEGFRYLEFSGGRTINGEDDVLLGEELQGGSQQPNVSLLPDTRSRWRTSEGWEKRAALYKNGYHLFYTHARGGLPPNQNSASQVYGDVFILKLSDVDEVDQDGLRFYVDLNPKSKEFKDFLSDCVRI